MKKIGEPPSRQTIATYTRHLLGFPASLCGSEAGEVIPSLTLEDLLAIHSQKRKPIQGSVRFIGLQVLDNVLRYQNEEDAK